jgi:hypothetical protein
MRKLAIMVSLVLLISLPSGCGGNDAPNMSHVRFYCEEAVRARLKAPSSAEFSNQFETEISEVTAGQTYRVRGSVDAQNSFGAKIRGRYICTVSTYRSGNKRTYVVDSVSF